MEDNFIGMMLRKQVRDFWNWIQSLPDDYIIQMKNGNFYAIPPNEKGYEK